MSDAYSQALGKIKDSGDAPAAVARVLLAALKADDGGHIGPDQRRDLETTVYRLAGLPGPDADVTEAAHRLGREIAEYERDKWLCLLAPGSREDG